MVVIRNVSFIAEQEKLQSEYEYHQALLQSHQLDDLTPLSTIINISEMIMASGDSLDSQLKDSMNLIWCSG